MKKTFSLFILITLSIFHSVAKAQEKELLFNLTNGNSLYMATNQSGKIGIVDNNDKTVIPFKFEFCQKIHDQFNAFFVMRPHEGEFIELYNLDGKLLVDTSKEYRYVDKFGKYGVPGYIIGGDKGKTGLLDVYLNEIVSPEFAEINYIPTPFDNGNKFIATSKEFQANRQYGIFDISGLNLDKNGSVLKYAMGGKAIIIYGALSKNDDVVNSLINRVTFYALKDGQEGHFCWHVEESDKTELTDLNKYSFRLNGINLEKGKDVLIVKENPADGKNYIRIDFTTFYPTAEFIVSNRRYSIKLNIEGEKLRSFITGLLTDS